MRRYQAGPTGPHSRSTLVLGLYGSMALVAVLWGAGRASPDIYRTEAATATSLMLSPLLGTVLGLAVVYASRWATERYAWAQQMRRDFRDVLGPLTHREIVILAAASSIGEELFFRGALQPVVGVWVQAGIFAVLHVGPGRRFLVWTAAAAGLGLAFGAIAEATGNLGAPIAAHFVINYLNLRFIALAPARAWLAPR